MDEHIKSFLEEVSQGDLFQRVGNICSIVNSVATEQELLKESLKQVLTLFKANRGSIFISRDNSDELVLCAAYGMEGEEEELLVKRMGEGIVGLVAQSMRPIFVDNIADDNRFENYKARQSYSTPSFICVPMLVKDALLGVINISDKQSGGSFFEEEMQLLDFLSSQIALNYKRTQIYQNFKKVLRETQDLKSKLGQSDQETQNLRKQIVIQEKLATIGKLAGGIAHEFNNPLDGVIRYTNLCLEHVKDDDVVRGYLLEIKQGLHRMTNIVKNLLFCARSDYLRAEKISFYGALSRALKSVASDLSCKNISVKKEVAENLPEILDLGLERVLTNLFRNAIDAMEEEGALTIEAKCLEENLCLIISDTGGGIETERIEKVFEPFYTTKDMEKGCGLGLTIVGEILKSYQGEVFIDSSPGKGTTFTLKIPIKASGQ